MSNPVHPLVDVEAEDVHHLLVAADTSPGGDAAVSKAAAIAERAAAELTVVFVRHIPSTAANIDPVFMSDSVAEKVRNAFGYARDRVWANASRVFDPLRIRWTFEVRSGSPGVEIVKAADEAHADLIVIGITGRDADRASTAGYVIAHARVPVAVAHSTGASPPADDRIAPDPR